ncbi:LTA synthase family protein [Aliamphritea spongicola]|uniref:LTA synthase family protein n=1 Tax=Aliamphritea spongicola TaxID=707589 RepID=UPI001FAF275E|nr:LTA synthase family protein [Aliamphritea spongicola]
MKNLKNTLGPVYPVVMAGFALILLMTVFRLGLALWQSDRVSATDGWLAVFASGLRVDIASVCILFLIPAMLLSLFSGEHLVGRVLNYLLRIWITVALWFVVYMESATPAFILEYDLRPNRLFIEYLIYPKEVFSMLWTGYKFELALSLVVSVITLVLGWRFSGYLVTGLRYPKWYWRPLVLVAVVLIGALGARSSLGHRPLNPAMVSFSSDPLMNDLVLNSGYSVLFAAKQMSSEASAFSYYPDMPEEDIIAEIKASMVVDKDAFIPGSRPTLANHYASYQGKPKNIVILLLESHGARYVKSLGGIDASPNLDKLMQEGWGFTRMYASGTRSVRGIEAITTGFTPTPARAVVKLGASQTNFFTIADVLKSNGYHTQFVYGGESHFDNMKSFFLGNGFTDMHDFPRFESPEFVGSWGASDEDLYKEAHQQFSQLSKQEQPFFSLVFSSSNHTPFEYPEGKITPYNQPAATVENAVKYADYALGQFVERAKQSDYWESTIFIAVADHDSRASGSLSVPVGHFKIPAIIFGGGIEARQDSRLASQIDLPPTLLSLAGISSQNPMIGNDLTKDVPVDKQRALMQRGKNFGWMKADNGVVVIQPGQGISTYAYDPQADSLTPTPLSEADIKRAHANAMWGSLAFKKGYYQALPDYQPTRPEPE